MFGSFAPVFSFLRRNKHVVTSSSMNLPEDLLVLRLLKFTVVTPMTIYLTSHIQPRQPLQTVTTTTVTPYHVSHTPSRHAATTPRTTTRRTTKRTDYQTGTDTQHDTSHQNATHHERTVYHDDYSDHTTGHAYSYTTIYRPRHTSTTSHDYTAPHHRATTSDHSYDTDLWSRDHNPPRLRSSPHLHDYTVTTSTDYHRQTTTSATTTDDYLRAQRHIHDHDYGTVTLTPPTLPPRLYHCYDLPPRLASSATTTVTDHHHVSLPPDDTPCHHHRSDYPTVHTTLARNSAQCTYQANDY
nr:cell wall protein DAN4-like [Penaeus vannamei]